MGKPGEALCKLGGALTVLLEACVNYVEAGILQKPGNDLGNKRSSRDSSE